MVFSQEVCEYFIFFENLCIPLLEAGGIFVSHKDHIMASRTNNIFHIAAYNSAPSETVLIWPLL